MYKGQTITVIIPCLNEEQGIEQILAHAGIRRRNHRGR
jgi:hypothetical protein